MRNCKKILSIVLVLMMVFSACAVASVSAAEGDQTIYFEVPADWENYKSVFCHIFIYGGEDLSNWQSKKEKCTATETEGVYSYDIAAKVGGIEEGVVYGVIFSLDTGMETYTTLMTTECMGDTLYCDDTYYENPVDSSKISRAAFWKNQDKAQYGPLLQITSIGNLVGTALPPDTTAEDIFLDFLMNNLENARTYSGKSDQAIMDGVVEALNLTVEDATNIILGIGNSVTWTLTWNGVTYGAPATDDENAPHESTIDFIRGDADMDGKVNVKDATYVQKAIAELVTMRLIERIAGDVTGDNSFNVKDATNIQKHVAGMDVSPTVGVNCKYDPKTGIIYVQAPSMDDSIATG